MENDVATIDKEAVERAVRFAAWNAPAPGGSLWVMGTIALDTWANALRTLPDIKDYWSGYGGNSYVAQCVRESRFIAAEFLKRLCKKYHVPQSKHLRDAAECYERDEVYGRVHANLSSLLPSACSDRNKARAHQERNRDTKDK